MMGSKLKCVSIISAVPSIDDMPGVDSLNITLHAPPRTPPRAPLERRSRVIARKFTAEDQVAASPTTTTNDDDKNEVAENSPILGATVGDLVLDPQTALRKVASQMVWGWQMTRRMDADGARPGVDDIVKAARASRHHH
jgi:hypothetical protein